MIKLPILTCSLLAFGASSAMADEYMFTMHGKNNQSIYFVDTTSINQVGDGVYTAWEVAVFNGDNIIQGMKSTKFLTRVDCKARTTQEITATYYDANDNALNTDSRPKEMNYVVPDSEGSYVIDIVCAGPDRETKYANRKIGDKTPTSIADYMYAKLNQ